jgi:hypothetical protein
MACGRESACVVGCDGAEGSEDADQGVYVSVIEKSGQSGSVYGDVWESCHANFWCRNPVCGTANGL